MGSYSALQWTQGWVIIGLISDRCETSASCRGMGQAGDTETQHLPGIPPSCASTVTNLRKFHVSNGYSIASSLCTAPETPASDIFCLGCPKGSRLSSLSSLLHAADLKHSVIKSPPLPPPQHHHLAQMHFSILLLIFDNSHPRCTPAFYPKDTCSPVCGVAPKVCSHSLVCCAPHSSKSSSHHPLWDGDRQTTHCPLQAE